MSKTHHVYSVSPRTRNARGRLPLLLLAALLLAVTAAVAPGFPSGLVQAQSSASTDRDALVALYNTTDGTTMRVADVEEAEIYAYNMPQAESSDPPVVVFGNPNWTSALLQTEIARHMVEHGYGYATEKVFGGVLPLLQGLRDGDIHLLMEVWLPNLIEYWEPALSAGDILDLGTSLGNVWQSAFVIPAYLQEQYPGLDHVEDLKQQQYRSLFSTAETGGKARLVSCPVGWSCEEINRQQIEGYGLTDYLHVIKPGSQDAMFSEIYGAYERGEPWLGYMWGTGDPALLLDLVRLEEPAYSDKCWSTDRACAYEDDTILIGAHSSLPELAPDVVDFLEQWDFGVDVHLRYATRWMDANPEASIEEAALNWLANHVDTWSAWVYRGCGSRYPRRPARRRDSGELRLERERHHRTPGIV